MLGFRHFPGWQMRREPTEPGLLIVVEGIDGAGKSTLAESLHKHFAATEAGAIASKEPTQGKWGTILRETAHTGRLPADLELDLLMKDRAEHVEQLIGPALSAGKSVILDRYYFSSAAYQGAAGLNPEAILEINRAFAPEPDVLILLDLDPATGLDRIRTRGDVANAFEREDTLSVARQIFLDSMPEQPAGVVIDARKPAAEVFSEALGAILRVLGDKAISVHGLRPEAGDALMRAGFTR